MPADLDDLKSKALETAWRFLEGRMYGQRRSRAIAALKRRVTGWEREDCERWFELSLAACRDIGECIETESAEAWDLYRESMQRGTVMDFTPMAERIHAAHPDFPVDNLNGWIAMSFSWRELR